MKKLVPVLVILGLIFSASLGEAADSIPTQSLEEQLENYPITSFAIEGNRKVPTGQIMTKITNSKIGEPVREDLVRSDLTAIGEMGLFSDASAKFAAEGNGIKVIFQVVENPTVASVDVSCAGIPTQELKELMTVKAGQVLNTVMLQEDIKKITDFAMEEHGLVVRPVDVGLSEQKVLVLKFNQATIGKLELTGNEKTKDFVIMREFTMASGDVLNMNKLKTDLWKILNLGFFDEVVPHFEPTEDPDVVDLKIEVKERKTGTAAVGAGYGSSGLMGYVEVAENNFRGVGQSLNLRTQFGTKEDMFEFGFSEPRLGSQKLSFDVNVYNIRYKYGTDDTSDGGEEEGGETSTSDNRSGVSRGVDLRLGKPLTDYTRAYAKYRNTNYTQEGKDPTRIRSLIFSLYNNTADHPYNPTTGWRNTLTTEFAGRLLGGDQDFTKLEQESIRYFKMRKGHTLALRLSTGYGIGELPEIDKFRVGGAETLRGYDTFDTSGNKKILANAEYRFKLADNLQGVVFTDAGRAWKNEEKVNLKEIKVGAGVGLRIDTPIGMIRLDYGWGKDGKGQSYFSIGQPF